MAPCLQPTVLASSLRPLLASSLPPHLCALASSLPPLLCARRPIAEALLPLFSSLQEGALKSFSTLLSSLRMVFPDGPAACQAVAISLLSNIFAMGEPFSAAVHSLLGNFEPTMRTAQLSSLIERVEAEYTPPQ